MYLFTLEAKIYKISKEPDGTVSLLGSQEALRNTSSFSRTSSRWTEVELMLLGATGSIWTGGLLERLGHQERGRVSSGLQGELVCSWFCVMTLHMVMR